MGSVLGRWQRSGVRNCLVFLSYLSGSSLGCAPEALSNETEAFESATSAGTTVSEGGTPTSMPSTDGTGALDTSSSSSVAESEGSTGATSPASSSGAGDSSSSGDPEGTACPPMMVFVDAPGGAFCIDAYEATVDEFVAVVDDPLPGGLPPFCGASTLAQTYGNSDPGVPGDHPIWVSMCEAAGYCALKDKRLCGAIGGGVVPYGFTDDPAYDAAFDPSISEWQYACTAGGTQQYPYGDDYDETACVPGERYAVGSNPACEGGFAGIFDIVGNSVEWEYACFGGDDEPSTYCRARGDGAAEGYTPDIAQQGLVAGCSFYSEILFDSYLPANFRTAAARCCSDPIPR